MTHTVKQTEKSEILIKPLDANPNVILIAQQEADGTDRIHLEKSSLPEFLSKVLEAGGEKAKIHFPEDVTALINLFENHKPWIVWHEQWSTRMPFLFITEYRDGSFMYFCNSWSKKTPEWTNPELLHSYLKYQGLTSCYIEVLPQENISLEGGNNG